MLSIALVDDDKKELENLKNGINLAQEVLDERFRVTAYSEGIKFIEAFKDQYDIVFLDIDMPVIGGMELAKRIRQTGSKCCIVFVTNLPQYAIQGYEVEAISYLLKPIGNARLNEVLKKAVSCCKCIKEEEANIVLKTRNSVQVIAASDIYYIEVSGHDLIFYTTHGTALTHKTMKEVEDLLGKRYFARCNSCYLVNLRYVDSIVDNFVTVKGEKLLISRHKKKGFIEKYITCVRIRG